MKYEKSLYLLILCFFNGISADTDGRIIGGRPALPGEIPYQISLRRSYNDNHYCGGTLISRKFVLTAAHCMFYRWGGITPPLIVSAVAGQLNLTNTKDTIYRNASRIIIHPDYNNKLLYNDIALIEVDDPFPTTNNPFISDIALTDVELTSGNCLISGWGKTKVDSTELVSESLLAATVEIVPFEECSAMYALANITLDPFSMMCAGHLQGSTDACQGDSGGPLVCNGKLTGVISTGAGCGLEDFPGIYANVYKFLDWILENVVESTPSTDATTATTTPVMEMTTKTPIRNMLDNFFDTIGGYFCQNCNGSQHIQQSVSVILLALIFIQYLK